MKAIWKYLAERKEAIRFLLAKEKNVFTPRTFHKLRVEIKKLDAFLRLLKYSNKNFRRKKTFKPFRQIFSLAGKVRELQIEEAMMSRTFDKTVLVGYRRDVRKLRVKEREAFFSLVNAKFLKGLETRLDDFDPYLRKVGQEEVAGFLAKKRKQIARLLPDGTVEPAKAHDIRKKLKQYHYIQDLLTKTVAGKSIIRNEEFHELLGKWQDNKVLLDQLRKARENGDLPAKDLGVLKKTEQQIMHESETAFKNVLDCIPRSGFMG